MRLWRKKQHHRPNILEINLLAELNNSYRMQNMNRIRFLSKLNKKF
jgi:hypothetical protein